MIPNRIREIRPYGMKTGAVGNVFEIIVGKPPAMQDLDTEAMVDKSAPMFYPDEQTWRPEH